MTMGLLRPIELGVKQLKTDGCWYSSMLLAAWRDPAAAEFCRKMEAEAFVPEHLVRVLPSHNAIYLMVPKVASTRIRKTLGAIAGRYSRRLRPSQWGRIREAQGPRSMTVQSFYRLATSPETFRFTFVRNPYERLLAVWASSFQDIPLVPGQYAIDDYLRRRAHIDRALPAGADQTLSFEEFTRFVIGRLDAHEQHFMPQDELLTVPGIALDFVGRIESFGADFGVVLDRLGASEEIRREALVPINTSRHSHWSAYYTAALADRVYTAYERDFDRFGYPRTLPAL